uniref:LigA n=1 Tax=Parastrongyloides trichosuri TaxID=131310 RepID=A0A0N4Z2T5_PARTI
MKRTSISTPGSSRRSRPRRSSTGRCWPASAPSCANTLRPKWPRASADGRRAGAGRYGAGRRARGAGRPDRRRADQGPGRDRPPHGFGRRSAYGDADPAGGARSGGQDAAAGGRHCRRRRPAHAAAQRRHWRRVRGQGRRRSRYGGSGTLRLGQRLCARLHRVGARRIRRARRGDRRLPAGLRRAGAPRHVRLRAGIDPRLRSRDPALDAPAEGGLPVAGVGGAAGRRRYLAFPQRLSEPVRRAGRRADVRRRQRGRAPSGRRALAAPLLRPAGYAVRLSAGRGAGLPRQPDGTGARRALEPDRQRQPVRRRGSARRGAEGAGQARPVRLMVRRLGRTSGRHAGRSRPDARRGGARLGRRASGARGGLSARGAAGRAWLRHRRSGRHLRDRYSGRPSGAAQAQAAGVQLPGRSLGPDGGRSGGSPGSRHRPLRGPADAGDPGGAARLPRTPLCRGSAGPSGRRGLAGAQGQGQGAPARHGRGADRPGRQAGAAGVRRHHAAGWPVRRVLRPLPLRGDGRPTERHRRRAGRPGQGHADGSPGLRRCGLRQDRGRGRHARADDAARQPALRDVQRTLRRLADQGAPPVAHGHGQGRERDARGPEGRQLRDRRRHPRRAGRSGRLQGSGPRHRGRGAALRREAQGEAEVLAGRCSPADPDGDTYPTHPADGAVGHPRNVDHRHAAGRPSGGADLCHAVGSGAGARGPAAREVSRRPGLLRRAAPEGPAGHRAVPARAGARGEVRRRPRPDEPDPAGG